VADRDEETGNTTVDEKEATPEVMCTYLSLVSRDRLLLTISPQGLNVVICIVDVRLLVFYWILFLTLFCISIHDVKLVNPVSNTLTRW